MKVTDTYWFTPAVGDPVGIIVGVDEVTGKRKAYIGSAAAGGSEEFDTQAIAEYGAKLNLQVLLEIVSNLIGLPIQVESVIKMQSLE